jgi:CRP-like cAMP-binding protein
LTGQRRAVTVVAQERVEALVIDKNTLQEMR